jgi:hypothetical protein
VRKPRFSSPFNRKGKGESFSDYKAFVFELKQTEPFRKWRMRLKDERAPALIASRLDRLAFGNTGDVRPVG